MKTVQNTATGGVTETFTYDLNGNVKQKSNPSTTRQFFWDESDRLRVVKDPTSMQHYFYDAAGERVLKGSSAYGAVSVNGSPSETTPVTISGYTSYPSGFVVIDASGNYSKHYYAGSQRIVSRIGESTATIFEPPVFRGANEAKNQDVKLQQLQIADLQQIMEKGSLGKAVFTPYKAYSFEQAEHDEQISNMEFGGDTDGGTDPGADGVVVPGTDAVDPNDPPPQQINRPIYFYHPDHLGTSTFLTDFLGKAYQFFINLPFGETMAEQLPATYYKTPYKFTGKELDAETGLYYYGARYYDPKVSIWLSVDPLASKYPNLNPYVYAIQNPVTFIDPDGRDVILSPFFSSGQYGKMFVSLKNSSETFRKLLSKFENNKKFNLKLTVNDRKVEAINAAAFTEYSKDQYTKAPTSLNVTTYFKSGISVETDYEYSEIGVLLVVAHEALHQEIALLPVNEDDNHNQYNKYINDLISIFTEYNNTNGSKLSADDIKDLAYSGQQKSKNFKDYITDKASKNGTTYEKEKKDYDRRVSNLIYKKKDEEK